VFAAALLVVGLLVTAAITAWNIPFLLDGLTTHRTSVPGLASSAFSCGVFGYAFGALAHRVAKYGVAEPTGHAALVAAFDVIARGWGLGVTILSARVLGEGLRSFGAPASSGSFLADGFFFVVTSLIVGVPGLLAAFTSWWLSHPTWPRH
jgi:hypothetical protein